MANAYYCTGLTGGATTDLDYISVAGLVDGDFAWVFDGSNSYLMLFDADGTNAEDSPNYIRPDDYATQGVWVLQPAYNSDQWRKNLVINGCFRIWQRGTSQTATDYGSDDRWRNDHNGTTKTHTQQAFTVGQTDVPGEPVNYSRTVVTSSAGAGNYCYKTQRIDNVRTAAGQTVTLSFYAKADASKNIAVEFTQGFGSGGSATVESIESQKVALTTSWQKFTITAAIPSISGKTIGSGSYLGLRFWFDAGSDYNSQSDTLGQQSGTFEIAQVQLEIGSAATEFEVRGYSEEAELCHVYYWRGRALGNGQARHYGTSGSQYMAGAYIVFGVRMRTSPTMAVATTPTYENCSFHSWATSYNEGAVYRVDITSSAVYRAYNGIYEADAEL